MMPLMLEMLPDLTAILSALSPLAAEAGGSEGLESLWSVEALVALLTLSALEIVLGIDNVVFIAILAGKLPIHQQKKARTTGLLLAMVMRILLLLAIGWIMGLTRPWFTLPLLGEAGEISGRDLILLVGGLFLLGKSTWEIHDKLEGDDHAQGGAKPTASFSTVILQILALDLVFSLDSVITAVGMVQPSEGNPWAGLTVMIAAVMIAIGVMLAFAGVISDFVERHPTMKMLALTFLLLIGVVLVTEAFNVHVPKGYIYFSMAFALGVEVLNIRIRKVSKPVKLHQSYVRSKTSSGYGDAAEGRASEVQPTKPA